MPIPAGVQKVVLSGQMPGGEIWQSGFYIGHSVVSAADAATMAQNYWTILSATGTSHMIGQLFTKFGNAGTTFTMVSVYGYTDTSGIATWVGQYGGTGPSTGAVPRLPDQTCIVLTTHTSYSGRSHRGRMYLPATGGTLDTNGLFSGPDLLTLMTGAVADIKACEVASGGFSSCVVSQKLGTYATIQSLSVDQRPDIQRRRANRQTKGTTQTLQITRP